MFEGMFEGVWLRLADGRWLSTERWAVGCRMAASEVCAHA